MTARPRVHRPGGHDRRPLDADRRLRCSTALRIVDGDQPRDPVRRTGQCDRRVPAEPFRRSSTMPCRTSSRSSSSPGSSAAASRRRPTASPTSARRQADPGGAPTREGHPRRSGGHRRDLHAARRCPCEAAGAGPADRRDRRLGQPLATVERRDALPARAGLRRGADQPQRAKVLGRPTFATLEEATAATGTFDIVDVFRRPEHAPDIARSAVAAHAGALWLQLGVVNWEAAAIAQAAGMPIVMDRCTRIEHHRIHAIR